MADQRACHATTVAVARRRHRTCTTALRRGRRDGVSDDTGGDPGTRHRRRGMSGLTGVREGMQVYGAGQQRFESGTIRVPVRGEEAAVEKEAVVTGEVVVDKERTTERQEVADTVRKERVEVDNRSRQGVAGAGGGGTATGGQAASAMGA